MFKYLFFFEGDIVMKKVSLIALVFCLFAGVFKVVITLFWNDEKLFLRGYGSVHLTV